MLYSHFGRWSKDQLRFNNHAATPNCISPRWLHRQSAAPLIDSILMNPPYWTLCLRIPCSYKHKLINSAQKIIDNAALIDYIHW